MTVDCLPQIESNNISIQAVYWGVNYTTILDTELVES
jgi:hypothetical protein